MKPEWKKIAENIFWCRGCGCLKIIKDNNTIRYHTPKKEYLRRKNK
jgi:hypothetical protein